MTDDRDDTVATRLGDDAIDDTPPHPDPGSFRDPGSRVFLADGEVHRAVDQRTLDTWKRLSDTTFYTTEEAAGRIIGTDLIADGPAAVAADPTILDAGIGDQWAGIMRHERIPAISYPYEWTFSMLRQAALLQLELLEGALAEDMILKDSTPYNIQWRGVRPVFIDIGSFEALEPGDVWVGYRQFLRQYLYPLLLQSHVGVPFQPWLLGRPEGPTAEELWRLLSARNKLRRSTLLHVGLQARAERRYRDADRDVRSELKEAGFDKNLIESNIRGLRAIVEALAWDHGDSEWNRYAADCGHVAVQRRAKSDFLTTELAGHPPSMVWDVGANDGHFSRLAAATADHVLALDADEVVLDELFLTLRTEGVDNVLPLIQDMSSPSPALGWRGSERTRLVDRASPDLVICFAVIHHLVIGRNLPLGEVVDWLAGLDSRVILEFVPPGDPMVDRLSANKRPHEIHSDYTEEHLRRYLDGRFVIDNEEPVPGSGRRMFALRPVG